METNDGAKGPFDISAVNFIRFYWVYPKDCDQDWILKLDNIRLTDAAAQEEAKKEEEAQKILEKYADLLTAIDALESIANVTVNAENYETVKAQYDAVKAQYDALTEDEQTVLSDKGYTRKITDAFKPIEKYEELLAKAESLKDIIAALEALEAYKDASAFTHENYDAAKKQIGDARKAYEALVRSDKKFLEDNGYLAHLVAAEAALPAEAPEAPCTEHVDADNNGKCDNSNAGYENVKFQIRHTGDVNSLCLIAALVVAEHEAAGAVRTGLVVINSGLGIYAFNGFGPALIPRTVQRDLDRTVVGLSGGLSSLRCFYQLLLLFCRREVGRELGEVRVDLAAALHAVQEAVNVASDGGSCVGIVKDCSGITGNHLFQYRIRIGQICAGCIGIGCLQVVQHVLPQPIPLSQHVSIGQCRLNGSGAIALEGFLFSLASTVLIEVSQECITQQYELTIYLLNRGSRVCGRGEHEVGNGNHQFFRTNVQRKVVIPTDEIPTGRIEFAVLYVEFIQAPHNVVPTIDPAGIFTGELLCAFFLIGNTAGSQLEAELNFCNVSHIGYINIKDDVLHAGDIGCSYRTTFAVTEHKATGAVRGTCGKASVLNLGCILPVFLQHTMIPFVTINRNNNGILFCGILCTCTDDDVCRQRKDH